MAERSTARSADGAAQDHDDVAHGLDSWIARRSRLATGDSPGERPEPATPQWRDDVSDPYEASYQPSHTYQEHEGRRARPRHQRYADEYGQHDGAYGQWNSAAHPEPAHDERDGQHEDAYAAPREPYAQPEAAHAHDGHYPHAGRDEYRRPAPDAPGRPRRRHTRERDAHPRPPDGRRRWLIAAGGLALGALLCALAVGWWSGRPPAAGLPVSAATAPPDPSGEPVILPEAPSAPPASAAPSTTPSATPSVTPSATPSASPSVTPSATPTPTPTTKKATPTPTPSPSPALLGPSTSRGVTNMVQRYCDRHTGGSADPRNDGRWQCTSLLSASIVDMTVACRDTYGSGAYARTATPDDPYAWRCYR
ncbi:hypothetical protein ACGFI9_03825 [Micromonospora sp. NPDC048930]|uniref:hypothetical protein n=1 Tax=Micromonospora sp. NPDC048930 TaxID=3364261 RepID=UPI00371024F5